MFSVLLELPEFEVVNQEILSTHYLVHVEKKMVEERCTHCGFHTRIVHDSRTRKIRDLSVLNKPLILLVYVKRYRCQNCEKFFHLLLNQLLHINIIRIAFANSFMNKF
ncbi:transposase family protein [Neobacillus pocheonensis]|uniref:Transposase family protein n=1 Tax=Neobacillus pocheonensis TaxID=363869 RepID=A0ABT0WEA9_9BACI|nr:transposase family protein [Neobacillus pocheonensis]